MNTEPTDEQINRGIAKWMLPEYTDFDNLLGEELAFGVREWEGRRLHMAKPGDDDWTAVPPYTTSHDACHEVLERMTEEQVDIYADVLGIETGASFMSVTAQINAKLHRATARQKALAIYKTITQEKE